ncbi:hypothetical protein LSTR_LSTR015759 [Laodelphax striatellus]|uniref:CUB domain-containing protein n=1 Tax=Laodelphax striatellus TaxID=195883 RepID=A0A482WTG0_LAOST|nr:hypothetical protein LSTR_LSTR015759 [Laodelphax striatellus]
MPLCDWLFMALTKILSSYETRFSMKVDGESTDRRFRFHTMTFFMEVKRDHCNKTVDIYEDVSSPEVTPDNVGRPMTCWYRFRSFRGTPRDWILRIRFKKFKVGTLVNATYCHNGYMQGTGNF